LSFNLRGCTLEAVQHVRVENYVNVREGFCDHGNIAAAEMLEGACDGPSHDHAAVGVVQNLCAVRDGHGPLLRGKFEDVEPTVTTTLGENLETEEMRQETGGDARLVGKQAKQRGQIAGTNRHLGAVGFAEDVVVREVTEAGLEITPGHHLQQN
jgi:hypothetical protein